MKSKWVAILLAFFLGWIWAHKFYLRSPRLWIWYLLFFWTFIPAFLAIIDIVALVIISDEQFNKKYNLSDNKPDQWQENQK